MKVMTTMTVTTDCPIGLPNPDIGPADDGARSETFVYETTVMSSRTSSR